MITTRWTRFCWSTTCIRLGAVSLLILLLAGCEEDVLTAEHTDRP